MTVELLPVAAADVEEAFDHYRAIRPELGTDFVAAFRHAADRIAALPGAWHPLDAVYRRCRLRKFPYGIIYRVDEPAGRIVIVGVLHLSRDPNTWRRRV